MSRYVSNKLLRLCALVVFGGGLTAGCATMEVKPTAFRAPTQYQNHYEHSGFTIAFLPILNEEESRKSFNVDFGRTDVIPVRVIVQNRGNREIMIDAKQVFGTTSEGDFYQSYDLDQSTRIIRRSEIGKGMATGAAVGALAGAAIGAGVGAAVGHASGGSGHASRGAESGAIIGGTAGAVGGVTAGADAIDQQVRREMRRADWGTQVIYPGEMKTGFIFFPRVEFREIAFSIYDLIERKPISAAVTFQNRQ